jgi:ABC-type lipoprotein export system ATPase subunit
MNPAVRLDGITKRFPGVIANDDVDLTIEAGSVHALLGENGAGKTTLMNVLYGLYQPTAGRVVVDGEPRSFDSPADAIDAGIGMIHQHFMLVPPMQVWENVVLGNEPRTWGGLRVDRAAARTAVRELSERYGFDVDPDARIEDTAVGVQQRVEILKALYRGADVLIMDEPTAVRLRGAHRAGKDDPLYHPQARRGALGGRPRDRASGWRRRRHGRGRRRDPRGARGAHGRPRGVDGAGDDATAARRSGALGDRPPRRRRPGSRGGRRALVYGSCG